MFSSISNVTSDEFFDVTFLGLDDDGTLGLDDDGTLGLDDDGTPRFETIFWLNSWELHLIATKFGIICLFKYILNNCSTQVELCDTKKWNMSFNYSIRGITSTFLRSAEVFQQSNLFCFGFVPPSFTLSDRF